MTVKRATLVIGMLAFVTAAEAMQNEPQWVCPVLLTEQECHAYHAEISQASSPQARALLENRYAELLRERALLCPCVLTEDQHGAKVTARGDYPRPSSARRNSM